MASMNGKACFCLLMVAGGIAGAAPPQPPADCSAALSADARKIYDASLPALTPGASLKEVVTAKTRELVMDGKLERPVARPSANEAGKCLRQHKY